MCHVHLPTHQSACIPTPSLNNSLYSRTTPFEVRLIVSRSQHLHLLSSCFGATNDHSALPTDGRRSAAILHRFLRPDALLISACRGVQNANSAETKLEASVISTQRSKDLCPAFVRTLCFLTRGLQIIHRYRDRFSLQFTAAARQHHVITATMAYTAEVEDGLIPTEQCRVATTGRRRETVIAQHTAEPIAGRG